MKYLFLLFLLGLTGAVSASARTETTHDVDLNEVIAETRVSVDLANAGQYGSLSRRQLQMVNAALVKIEDLAAGKIQVSELSSSERDDLDDARTRIDQILRARNKNRIVCQRDVKTGTRLAKVECLTVGQREERANNARKQTASMQRTTCVPGGEGGSRCGGK